jgi:hypothetical protein
MPHLRNREGPPLPHSVHREDLAEELTTRDCGRTLSDEVASIVPMCPQTTKESRQCPHYQTAPGTDRSPGF